MDIIALCNILLISAVTDHMFMCVFDVEGCEESKEAIKAGQHDVSARLASLKANESRTTSAAATFQTTWSYQGTSCFLTQLAKLLV